MYPFQLAEIRKKFELRVADSEHLLSKPEIAHCRRTLQVRLTK